MPEYDPAIIGEHAARLYRHAEQTIALYALGGAILIGGPAAGIVGWFPRFSIGWALAAALLGALLGYTVGREKAFELRLKAQTALCQAQIEANTRKLLIRDPSKEVAALPRHGDGAVGPVGNS